MDKLKAIILTILFPIWIPLAVFVVFPIYGLYNTILNIVNNKSNDWRD